MQENDKTQREKKELPPQALATLPEISSSLSLYLNPDKMNQLYKVATMFAESDIIPKAFQGKKGNCFIALEMASNMGVSPIFLMQNLAVVNGKPTIEAKLVTAMVNNSGRFIDPLEYEVVGADPSWNKSDNKPIDPTYKVRCYAVLKKTGKTLYGPWITWDMVMAEGWQARTGSKWLSLPEMMFMYRAASYFAKVYCSDLTYGMQSTEEMQDVIDITPPNQTGSRAGGRKERARNILAGFDDEAAEETQPDAQEPCPHPEEQGYPQNDRWMCGACGEDLGPAITADPGKPVGTGTLFED